MLRTWAVYGRTRVVAIALIAWTVVAWAPIMASLGIFLSSLRCECVSNETSSALTSAAIDGPNPQGVPSFGCFVVSGSPISFVCWVLLMIFEAGEFLVYKAFSSRSLTPSISEAILALMVYKAVKDCTATQTYYCRRDDS